MVSPSRLVGVAILAGSLIAHAGASATPATPELKVMSFNVRCSSAQDGDNVWPNRVEVFFDCIRRFNPDLIGFQEVLADQYDAIARNLPDFEFRGGARNDGKRSGEWSLVGYRKSRFADVSHGDFWLSEQPSVPGSKSWDAAITRLCSWTRLKDRVTAREIVFANTHFDHKGVIARRESSRLLTSRLSTIANGAPAVLTGDFNFSEDDPGYTTLVSPGESGTMKWIDSYRSLNPQRSYDESTFHGFRGVLVGSRIDFIFHTSDFAATNVEIDRTPPRHGRWPSDHYAVTAILAWK